MNGLRAIGKSGLVRAAARIAPLTWKLRAPGSLVVLMYHRVLPNDSPARATEQPGMYVSPATLDMHLAEIKRHFVLVHLEDWLRRARDGSPLPRLACAITFDDGWRDNFEFALPLLQKHGAPATVFLVSTLIGTSQRFWPNRLLSLLRQAFDDTSAVVFPDRLSTYVDPVLQDARRRGSFRAEDAEQAIQGLKQLDEEAIRQLILEAERRRGEPVELREIVCAQEIERMAASGLVRFGSHTATHFRLGGPVPPPILEREIVRSRDELQDICGQPILLFCYPNGEISQQAVDLARRHYLGAVTTQRGWHKAGGEAHLIRRIGMHEDVSRTAESFLARVSAWF